METMCGATVLMLTMCGATVLMLVLVLGLVLAALVLVVQSGLCTCACAIVCWLLERGFVAICWMRDVLGQGTRAVDDESYLLSSGDFLG